MSEIAGLQLEVTASADKAISALDSLASHLQSIKTAVGKGFSLTNATNQIKNFAETIGSISFDRLANLQSVSIAMDRIGQAAQGLSGSIGSINKASNDFSESLANIGQSATSASSSIQTLNSGMHELQREQQTSNGDDGTIADDLDDIAPAAGRASAGISKVASAASGSSISFRNLASHAATAAKWLLKLEMAPIKGLAWAAGKSASAFSEMRDRISLSNTALGKLASSVQRIAFYRLIRTAIKEVTQGVKEGIDNLYAYSSAMNGSFAAAMDMGASASLKFKNSIGAMLGPAIEAVIPLLVQLANIAIAAANAINQFVSVLFGRSTWTHAADVAAGAGKALKGSGKAAKEADDKIKGLLADWDELNIIQQESSKSPGGGGGGGAGGISPGSMFVTEALPDNKWTNLAQQLKDLIGKGDWRGAGALLAEKLNGVLDKVNAREWTQKVREKLWAGLEMVNGFLASFHFETLGAKIGGFFSELFGEESQKVWADVGETFRRWLMAKIEILKGVVETDGLWEGLGTSIATTVNSFFDFSEQDIQDAAKALGGTISGIALATYNGLKQINFTLIGLKIRRFLLGLFGESGTIKGTEIGEALKRVFLSGFDVVRAGLGDENDNVLGAISKTVSDIINAFFDLDEKNDIPKIAGTLGNAIRSVFKSVKGLFGNGSGEEQGIDFSQIGWDVGQILKELPWIEIMQDALDAIGGIIRSGIDFVGGIIEALFPTTEGYGDVTLTKKQIEAFVNEKMLKGIDVKATFNLVKTTVSASKSAKENLVTQVREIMPTLNTLKLGVDEENSLIELKNAIFGTSEDDQNSLMGKFKANAKAQKNVVETAISLIPIKNENGEDVSSDFLSKSFEGWDLINAEMERLGRELNEHLKKGMDESLTTEMRDYEKKAVIEISETMARIARAAASGESGASAELNLELGMKDLSRKSVADVAKLFKQYKNEVFQGYTDIQKEAAFSYASQAAAYAEIAASATDAETKAFYEEKAEEYKALYEQFYSNALNGAEAATKEAVEKGQQMLLGWLQETFGEGIADINFNRWVDTDNANQAMLWINDPIDALRRAISSETKIPIDVFDVLEISGWDLLSEEAQSKLKMALEERWGKEKAQIAIDKIIGIDTRAGLEETEAAMQEVIEKAAQEAAEAASPIGVATEVDVTPIAEVADDMMNVAFEVESYGEKVPVTLPLDAQFLMENMDTDDAQKVFQNVMNAFNWADAMDEKAFGNLNTQVFEGMRGLGMFDSVAQSVADNFVASLKEAYANRSSDIEDIGAIDVMRMLSEAFYGGLNQTGTLEESWGAFWESFIGSADKPPKDFHFSQDTVDRIYDQLFSDLDTYDPEMPTISTDAWWESVLAPLVGDMSSAYGLSKNAAKEVADAFYTMWMASLTSDEWIGGTRNLMDNLQALIEEYMPDDAKAVSGTALDAVSEDAAEAAAGVQGASDNMNAALAGVQEKVEETETSFISLTDNISTAKPTFDASGTVNGLNAITSAANQALFAINALGGLSVRGPSLAGGSRTVGMYASGGFPTTGQMFIAREAGPEYVGAMGGHTAVANNDQIVSGIASGVAEANVEQNALLRQQNALLTQLLQKEFTARAEPGSGWGRFIHESNEAYARQTGRG